MKTIRALVIDHDPLPKVLRRAAASAGIDLEVHISKTYTDAMDWLWLSSDFDVIFVCYRFRNGDNAVDSLLIRNCIYSGFGGKKGKPLVAFSRNPESDQVLLSAGCNSCCDHLRTEEFFLSEFGQAGEV